MVSGLVPDEGLWVLVVLLDEAADSVLQFLGGAMDTTPQLLVGECGKPSLDQVEPTGRGGSEVQVEARSFGQPVADERRLVRPVVV